MAAIDAQTGQLLIRVTYDGSAMCGKTTTLRCLADLVAVTPQTPDEVQGRTLYFDWLEYVAGMYDGKPIRCQVVAVPGQKELESRRWHLVDRSDVLVYVIDSSPQGFEESFRQLERVHRRLSGLDGPIPGIVLQANKRDVQGAAPMEVIRERAAHLGDVAVVESVATRADGVRYAFVLAVRLGIDRARALAEEGQLRRDPDHVKNADGLLARMRDEEVDEPPPRSVTSLPTIDAVHSPRRGTDDDPFEPERSANILDDGSRPVPPDSEVLPGMVWPPIGGRIMLHEYAIECSGAATRRGTQWRADTGRWLARTDDALEFEDEEEARQTLVEWARRHARIGTELSPKRCLAGSRSGGAWRLWQVVHREDSLLALVKRTPADDAEAVGRGLAQAAYRLVAASTSFARAALPCTLETVSCTDTPRYVGLVPWQSATGEPTAPQHVADEALIRRELGGRIRVLVGAGRINVLKTIDAIDGFGGGALEGPPSTTEVLKAMLIGH